MERTLEEEIKKDRKNTTIVLIATIISSSVIIGLIVLAINFIVNIQLRAIVITSLVLLILLGIMISECTIYKIWSDNILLKK